MIMKCPKCESENVTHSHRRGTEKILKYMVPWVPYRCKECWTRFWKFRNPLKGLVSKLAVVLLLLLIGAGVWYFGPFRDKGVPPQPEQPKETASSKKTIKRPMPQMEEPEVRENVPEDRSKPDDLHVDLPELTQKKPALDTAPKENLTKKPTYGQRKADIPKLAKVKKDESPRKTPVVAKKVPVQKDKSKRTLKEILPRISPGEFSMELLAGDPIEGYTSFTIPSPPKVVVDILGKWDYPGKPTIWVRSDMVKRVRIGEHSDKLRLVLDLKGRKVFSPVIEQTAEGLKLTLRK